MPIAAGLAAVANRARDENWASVERTCVVRHHRSRAAVTRTLTVEETPRQSKTVESARLAAALGPDNRVQQATLNRGSPFSSARSTTWRRATGAETRRTADASWPIDEPPFEGRRLGDGRPPMARTHVVFARKVARTKRHRPHQPARAVYRQRKSSPTSAIHGFSNGAAKKGRSSRSILARPRSRVNSLEKASCSAYRRGAFHSEQSAEQTPGLIRTGQRRATPLFSTTVGELGLGSPAPN